MVVMFRLEIIVVVHTAFKTDIANAIFVGGNFTKSPSNQRLKREVT